MNIFKPARDLFLLRQLSFDAVAFSRWQSIIAISLIGLLTGFDPSMRASDPDMPPMPLTAALMLGLLSVWIGFLTIIKFLKWWLKRGDRWDGQGDLLNLTTASWLVADVLCAGLVVLGVLTIFTFPLWLFSMWVGANALHGAIPKVSIGYAIGGVVLSLIPAVVSVIIISSVVGGAMAIIGGA